VVAKAVARKQGSRRPEKDRAFEWLQRAYQQRDSGLNGILYDPLLTGLVGDPRFKALLKKLKLSE
jgi:adenylate cyclase